MADGLKELRLWAAAIGLAPIARRTSSKGRMPGASATAQNLSLPLATRVLDDPSDELAERPARMLSQLRHEGRSRHAGLRIDFEADQVAATAWRIVETEVRTRHTTAAERLMSRQCVFPEQLVNIR